MVRAAPRRGRRCGAEAETIKDVPMILHSHHLLHTPVVMLHLDIMLNADALQP